MFYCAGNWKMNKNPEQAVAYVRQLREMASAEELENLVVLPPALVASQVAEAAKGSSLSWGGQNCYFEAQGPFTGENSAAVFKALGARFCLVGHSERRQLFVENDEMLAAKVRFLQSLDLIPILCVGETQDDRRWNRTAEVIIRQTRIGLQHADAKKPIWLAYEPVWAIGTGLVATPDQVEEAHGFLRRHLKDWNTAAGERTPILYGGSVKSENANSLSGLPNVNGFLIGGASLDPMEFLKIYRGSISGNS